MIQGSIKGEDITLFRLYAPNRGAPKYTKQILTDIKGETDGNTILTRDFNTPLTSTSNAEETEVEQFYKTYKTF